MDRNSWWIIALVAVLFLDAKLPPLPNPVTPTPDTNVVVDSKDLRVLIVSESSARSGNTAAIIGSTKLREYKEKLLILDPDTDTSNLAKEWQQAMKLPRTSDPWILVSNGKNGTSQPLPSTLEATLELIRKYEK